MIDYQIIQTGSKGNAVVINKSILIDCGVPFKSLKDVHKGLQLVLLTHKHGDHFNRTTIRKLAQERPALRFGCCEWLVEDLVDCSVSAKNIDVYEPMQTYIYNGLCGLQPYNLTHNVPNCAYAISPSLGGYLFYATDTNSLEGIEAKNYDLYLIEANYGETEIIERIRQKQEAGEHIHEWEVLKNHLSREKAEDWLYRNMGQNSQYVLLHQHEGAFDD